MFQLDHIMYGVPDLDSGIAALQTLTGVRAEPGGSHPGAGTRNALLALGDKQYLEIIAPDPDQELKGTLGEALIRQDRPGVRAWAVATNALTEVAGIANRFGFDSRGIIDMSRTQGDGQALHWQLGFLRHRLLPFFIDWLDAPHPCETATKGCKLTHLEISVDHADAYANFLAALGLAPTLIGVHSGSPGGGEGFSATLQTPKGQVVLPNWWG